MLVEPTLQQLYKMRLNGMAEAFVQQMQDPAMEQLTFEDHFGMLVESQWMKCLQSCGLLGVLRLELAG